MLRSSLKIPVEIDREIYGKVKARKGGLGFRSQGVVADLEKAGLEAGECHTNLQVKLLHRISASVRTCCCQSSWLWACQMKAPDAE